MALTAAVLTQPRPSLF